MHIAFAYLDAGSVSMAVSAIAGGAAGIVVATRVGLRRFRDRLLRRQPALPVHTPPSGISQQAQAAENE